MKVPQQCFNSSASKITPVVMKAVNTFYGAMSKPRRRTATNGCWLATRRVIGESQNGAPFHCGSTIEAFPFIGRPFYRRPTDYVQSGKVPTVLTSYYFFLPWASQMPVQLNSSSITLLRLEFQKTKIKHSTQGNEVVDGQQHRIVGPCLACPLYS